jgi:dihydroxyacetone kinase-like protein
VRSLEELDTLVRAWLLRSAEAVASQRVWLTDLDAAIGDGDHGINLDRGLADVAAGLRAGTTPPGDPAATLGAAGRRVLGVVGGASGALYGRGLMIAAEHVRAGLPASGAGPAELGRLILEGSVAGITALGRASAGDKTMLDALLPALDALRSGRPDGADGADADALVLAAAADAAESGAAATVPLVARKGRASYLGERSAGHMDPGAASSAILVRCFAEAAQELWRSA